MLPDLRTILAAMALTAILVTLVGTTLMPVPGDPYIRSAGFPRVGQPLVQQAQVENPEQQQLHMLGYARRADELNRLLTLSQLPAPMARELPGAALEATDGGSLTDAKQGGDAIEGASPSVAVAPTRPAPDSDEQHSDVAVTGSVNSTAMAAPSEPAIHAATANEPAAPPVDRDPKIASTQSGSSETEAAQIGPEIAPINVLPVAKPKVHMRRRNRSGLATTNGTTGTASPEGNATFFNNSDRTVGTSERALNAAKPVATAPSVRAHER
jgi:hypothetical protein